MGTQSYSRIWTNLSDIRTFGLSFLWRHSLRVTGAPTAAVPIKGFGHIHLRYGDSDVEVIRQIFGERQYEVLSHTGARIFARYENILRSGRRPVIVDAGANIGAASLYFAGNYPRSAIVAVEPDLGNFQVLRKNATAHIHPVNAAIGATRGFVSVEKTAQSWASQTARAPAGVPVITMKDAFGSVDNGVPFIAKIDIEGFESDLFSQDSDWLADVYVVFIEPHDWLFPGQFTSQTFQRAMAQHNFEIHIRGENLIYVRC